MDYVYQKHYINMMDGLGVAKNRAEGPGGRTDRADGPGGRTGRKDRADGPGGRTGRTEGPDRRKDPPHPPPTPPKIMKIIFFCEHGKDAHRDSAKVALNDSSRSLRWNFLEQLLFYIFV